LLIVFAIVNVCALVLRRDEVDHDHFRAPTAMPVIGCAVSLAVMTTKDAETFARAAVLIAAGVALWLVTNWTQRKR
jgi:basic amino acid/polyamine antiporter, APA family